MSGSDYHFRCRVDPPEFFSRRRRTFYIFTSTRTVRSAYYDGQRKSCPKDCSFTLSLEEQFDALQWCVRNRPGYEPSRQTSLQIATVQDKYRPLTSTESNERKLLCRRL